MAEFDGHKIVISSLVGSWASNLNTENSDEDWKYFVAPTFDDLYNGNMFSSASVSDTLDYDVHDIRKLSELLWKGNLNFISVLFGRDWYCDDGLFWIFDNADKLGEMNLPCMYNSTMGMHYEKMSTLLKGTGNTQVLIDKYGYDTKQACHALRCLYVLNRISDGMSMREALWFDGLDRAMLIGVKNGNLPLDHFRDYVSVWRSMNDDRIKAWFSNQVADESMKIILDRRIKEFIRINL